MDVSKRRLYLWHKRIYNRIEEHKVVEFLPWSKLSLDKSSEKLKMKKLPILDIELGGACNLNCIYCDSPDRKKVFSSFEKVRELLRSGEFEWLFICGLGEPTVKENYQYLILILEECKKENIKCSMFTNLVCFDEVIFEYIREEVLYVMFKLDSFKEETIRKIYGRPNLNVQILKEKFEQLISLTRVKNGYTNICASIVPTTLNYSELPQLIEFCEKHDIFPLIGDLEDSGKGKDVYSSLKLTDEQLIKVKECFSSDYYIPICPSVLCGIHILFDGLIAVDRKTGLSCHWFWLEEPDIEILGKIDDYSTYDDLANAIFEYRLKRISFVKKYISECSNLIFGGCGGDIGTLLKKYINIIM